MNERNLLEMIKDDCHTRIYDEQRNYIKFERDYGTKKYKAYLVLKKFERPKLIWKIDIENNVLAVVRKDTHVFLKRYSYWFNNALIQRLPDDMVVEIMFPKKEHKIYKYVTNIKTIKEKGTFKYFLTTWYEKQIFLDITCLEKKLCI